MQSDQNKRRQQTLVHRLAIIFIFAGCFALPASADLVSGRVSGGGGKFQPQNSFVVKNSDGKVVKEVTTDEYKGFSVFLQPGTYIVEFVDKDKEVWQAPIQSFPQAARQDVELKKR